MKYIILIAIALIIPLSGSALTIEQRIEELYKLVYQLQAQLLELQKPIEPATTTPIVIEKEIKEIREEVREEAKPQIIEQVKPIQIPFYNPFRFSIEARA
jgi:predicted Holliday junction resolvase-like endonuclease